MIFDRDLSSTETSKSRSLVYSGLGLLSAWQVFVLCKNPPDWRFAALGALFNLVSAVLALGSSKLNSNPRLPLFNSAFLAFNSIPIFAWSWHLDFSQDSLIMVCAWLAFSLFSTATSGAAIRLALVFNSFSVLILGFSDTSDSNPSALLSATVSMSAVALLVRWFDFRQDRQILDTLNQVSALFSKMQEGMLLFDNDGRLLNFNPAASKILGMDKDHLAGLGQASRPWECFFLKGVTTVSTENPFARAVAGHSELFDQIYGIRRCDGGVAWIQLTASWLENPARKDVPSLLFTFSDVKEMKKSQEIILEQQARLEATAKLTALGEMAAGIAHEINNPLAIIAGKAFAVMKLMKSPEPSRDLVEASLDRILTTVNRVQKIVKGLQTFSAGGEQDPFERASLQTIVEEALSYCQDRLEEKQIPVLLDLEEGVRLECRPVQISQILVNLIQNASDAIEHRSDKWIRIWARSAHDTLVIKIIDSGPGIPEEIQKKLMQPFFTTKEVGKGTGLGLSITRGFVHSHLGKIWLDAKAPHTTFIIQLPLLHESLKLAS